MASMASTRVFFLRRGGASVLPSRTRRLHALGPRLANLNDRGHDTTGAHRQAQTQKPLNPDLRRPHPTATTENPDLPRVGQDKAPPELLSSAAAAEAEAAAAGARSPDGSNAELDVGEIEGGSFRIEPLKREGEDARTLRQRLLYQSRKRGTLESDLLLSTFADAHLGRMSLAQMRDYDRFLDENDWDIYYWATQEEAPDAAAAAEPAQDEWKRAPAKGEWAQTVGTFKPAYRPVPKRWQESEILKALRQHVAQRSAGGVGGEGATGGSAGGQEGLAGSATGTGGSGGGLGRMPDVKNFD